VREEACLGDCRGDGGLASDWDLILRIEMSIDNCCPKVMDLRVHGLKKDTGFLCYRSLASGLDG